MKQTKGKIVFFAVLSLVTFYIGDRGAGIIQSQSGNILEQLNKGADLIFPELAARPFFIAADKYSLLIGGICFISVWLIYAYNMAGRKNFRVGEEHGSAAWGTVKDIAPYIDKEADKNMLFSMTERMSMNTRQTFRNNNVLCIGGSGSGKTRFFVKPNIMQMHSSYVITDPKGSLIKECGKLLQDNGYKIKVFNLIDMKQSDQYNPLNYIRCDADVLKLVQNIVMNTNAPNSKNAGDFWEKSETALLEALISYVYYEAATPEEKNLGTVMEMLRLAEVREDDEDFKSPLDIMFEDLEKENPDHIACKQYHIFKLGAGKTAKSILISLGVRLAPFFIPEVANLVARDTIEMDTIGDEKTALFVILPDSSLVFNFLAAIMYQQLFDTLFYRADFEYGGRLPYHVRFMLDEFANIGSIPSFEVLIATMRSREISVSIVLQNLAQLKSRYKESAEIISGNCDTLLFLGGQEQSTLEMISKLVGKTTVDLQTSSESKGQSGSYSISAQVVGRELITPSEVGLLGGTECIVSIRGVKPFRSKKFDITKHKNYKFLSDFAKENTFSVTDRQDQSLAAFFADIEQVEAYTIQTE